MVRKHSKETKKKMRESALKSWGSGRKQWNKGLTKNTSNKVLENAKGISRALIGHKHSSSTIEKIRKKAVGRKHQEGTKEKISIGIKSNPKVMKTRFKEGHVQSEEINKKKASKGNQNPAWNYNKKNNVPDNLITLCNSCHTKTNWNRDHWLTECKIILLFNKKIGAMK
jgi:hypothetical protein